MHSDTVCIPAKRSPSPRTNGQGRSTGFLQVHTTLAIFVITCLLCMDLCASQGTCETKGCIEAAKEILANMDTSINPCDDFYLFACGTYLKNAVIPNGSAKINYYKLGDETIDQQLKSVFEGTIKPDEPKTFKVLQDYYNVCTDTVLLNKNSENELKEVLKSLGGWPLLEGPSWNEKDYDWKKNIYALRKLGFIISYFVTVTLGVDRDDSTRNVIYIDQPAFNIDVEYLRDVPTSQILQAYVKFMNDYAVLLGANPEQAKKELNDSFTFERELAKIALTADEKNKEENPFSKMTIQELEDTFKGFPWLEYINTVIQPEKPVDAQYKVIVSRKSYLGKFVALLAKTPNRVLANYIMWGVAFDSTDMLSERVKLLSDQFDSLISGATSSLDRWKFCLQNMLSDMAIGMSSVFVRRFYTAQSKVEALAMLNNIQKTFQNMIQQLDWMDPSTKKYAVEKLLAMGDYVGYPDELLDNKKIDDEFQGLTVDPKSYVKTQIGINTRGTILFLTGLHKRTNKTDWRNHATVAVVNAWQSDWENSVSFPAGILQGAFFAPDRTKYLNYASMGVTMGHETTHSFDDGGSQFDKDGNVKDWWQPQTRQNFNKKADCMKAQYSNYTVKEVNMKINGNLTIRENIADNGGYREAYFAYVDWVKQNGPEPGLKNLPYTPEQLFWIYSATTSCTKSTPARIRNLLLTDDHSPDQFRVDGPLANMVQFAQDFKCPLGTFMNPPNKCLVW